MASSAPTQRMHRHHGKPFGISNTGMFFAPPLCGTVFSLWGGMSSHYASISIALVLGWEAIRPTNHTLRCHDSFEFWHILELFLDLGIINWYKISEELFLALSVTFTDVKTSGCYQCSVIRDLWCLRPQLDCAVIFVARSTNLPCAGNAFKLLAGRHHEYYFTALNDCGTLRCNSIRLYYKYD